jgi:hypothetical protein
MTSTRSALATVPGVAVALLPKVACPMCWPTYAGLLTPLGLGFLLRGRWLLPATAIFLALALAALATGARRRRGLGPFFLGLGASALLLGGRFALGLDGAAYAAMPLLMGASLWNAWPRRG